MKATIDKTIEIALGYYCPPDVAPAVAGLSRHRLIQARAVAADTHVGTNPHEICTLPFEGGSSYSPSDNLIFNVPSREPSRYCGAMVAVSVLRWCSVVRGSAVELSGRYCSGGLYLILLITNCSQLS